MTTTRSMQRLRSLVRRVPAAVPQPRFGLPDLVATRRAGARLRVGVFVYEGVTTSEIEEPLRRLAAGLAADTVHVSSSLGAVVGIEPVRSVRVDATFEECPRLDVVLIPGGLGWRRIATNREAMRWLIDRTDQAAGTLAISTGTLILAAAGKLAGQAATGHWLARQELADLGATVKTDRVVHSTDDRLVTASGARAAIDVCDSFASRLRWGP